MVRGRQECAIGDAVIVDRETAVRFDSVLDVESGGAVSGKYAMEVQTQLNQCLLQIAFCGTLTGSTEARGSVEPIFSGSG